ncbi:hypothetical protein ABGB12_14535 [Actinocorallia sp. B10E7]|uniref:hypothetical protein n=1 Tax=Actinocorallia sp. B10E7 TaxID=3153558 RepID=UPI00325E8A17
MYQPPGPPGTPPPFGGTPPPFAPAPPPRRSKGPALALIGCGALVVVIALVVVLVAVLDGNKKTVIVAPPQSGAPTQSAPANDTPVTGGFGPGYVGTWQGTVIQTKPSTNKYTVTVVIPQNSSTGQITYENDPSDTTNWSCSGTVEFLHTTPGADYKSVVREHITNKNNAKCDTYSYNVLFPKPDNTGNLSDGMFIKNYFSESVADADNDHNAIGDLQRRN